MEITDKTMQTLDVTLQSGSRTGKPLRARLRAGMGGRKEHGEDTVVHHAIPAHNSWEQQ